MSVDLNNNQDYWGLSQENLLTKLKTADSGISETQAKSRQKEFGLNIIRKRKLNIIAILIRQFASNPLLIILTTATIISYLLGQHISSYYIFAMILLSVILGLWNEYSAEKTIDSLLKKISPTALVIRDNQKKEIPISHLTVGDIVLLSQGNIIPSDLRLIETNNLEINQAALTGESKTVYKNSDPITKAPSSVNDLTNIGFMGTHVESGSAKGVVVCIGANTQFGKIAQSATYIKPATDFQKGLNRFGRLIMKVILVLTVSIFGVNALLGHQILESLLFSLAIAVGLTPELLPVIVTISLSHGAGKLAKNHVVVKQLIAIENLGNMDILCTDKTGTLTEGRIEVVDYLDPNGQKDAEILNMALQANTALIHHKIIGNSIDVAIWEHAQKINFKPDKSTIKLTEEPFDYNRKAMYAVVKKGKEVTLIAKGAPETIISACHDLKDKKVWLDKFTALSRDGLRVIGLASKKVSGKKSYSFDDIKELTFGGFITFLDIPRKTTKDALAKLNNLNVQIKIITGDSEIITEKICKEIGMDIKEIILGSEMDKYSDEKLTSLANNTTIFARLNPQQKLRIIKTLQNIGHTVGYLGDGINDIPALRSADVGISVNSAIDVAKDAATIVLLRKSLSVIADGIIDGRKTFNNTIKYILMGTSSNFGNMFSAAGASFFLPFLPMTPVQILLTNGLYDISQLSIPTDNVDPESLVKPRHWDINFIKNYMIFFGPLSSIYDFLTYGVMIFLFHAKGALFQTGWFIESVATQVLVVFIIRTARKPFFKSKPSIWLASTCLAVVAVGTILPFTPLSIHLGFVSPPPLYFGILVLLVITYLLLVETVKRIFLKKYAL